jgi:hypothetical protein
MFSWVSNSLALHEATWDANQVDLNLWTKYNQFTQIEQTQQLLFTSWKQNREYIVGERASRLAERKVRQQGK